MPSSLAACDLFPPARARARRICSSSPAGLRNGTATAPENMFVVSVMPCTAKKYEIQRPEMEVDGNRDVDAVLTTRELARMIKTAGIDFVNLPEGEFDAPLGLGTGAADIFGVTGGVMEAALRTVYEVVT